MGAEGTGSCELGAELGEPSFGETQGEPSWVAFNQNPWIKEIRTLWVNLVRGKGINMERGWSGARLVGSKIQDILPARCTKIHKIDLPNCPKDPPATNIFPKNPSLFGNTLDLLGLTGVQIIQNVSRCFEISSLCFSDVIQKDRDAIMLRYVEPICSLNDVGEEMESKWNGNTWPGSSPKTSFILTRQS